MTNPVNKTANSIETLNNLTPKQIKAMSDKELMKTVSHMGKVANQRLKAFGDRGLSSPATRAALKKGRFGAKGKNRAQLLTEYKRAKSFLTSETGTIRGYKGFQKKIAKAYENAGVDVEGETPEETEQTIDSLTKIYDWLKDKNPWIADSGYKYEVQAKVSNMLDQGNLSETQIKRRMNKLLKEEYEKQQRAAAEDVSDFFDIGENE